MRSNMMMGAVCLIGASALAACQPSQSFDGSAKEAPPMTIDAQPAASATGTRWRCNSFTTLGGVSAVPARCGCMAGKLRLRRNK